MLLQEYLSICLLIFSLKAEAEIFPFGSDFHEIEIFIYLFIYSDRMKLTQEIFGIKRIDNWEDFRI